MKIPQLLCVVLVLALSGCEMIDRIIPSMPFNTPSSLDNPNDPLNPDNDIGPMPVTAIEGFSAATWVSLTWTTPVDVDQSHVRITWSPADGQSQPVTVFNSLPKTQLSATIFGLAPNTFYTFYLVVVDDDFRTGVSASYSIWTSSGTDTTPPSPVSSVDAAGGDTTVTLSWTNPSDSDFQDVEVTWTPQDGMNQPAIFTGTSGTVTGLTNGTTYSFSLRARDTSLNRSTIASATGTPSGTPSEWQWETLSISSPNYPTSDYGNNYDRTWEIRKTGATRIRIRFAAFNTESGYDFVELRDGTGALIESYSGNLGGFTSPEVSGEVILLRFTSDVSTTYSGWLVDRVEYQMPVQSGEDVDFNGGAYDLLIPVETDAEWQTVRFDSEAAVWLALEVDAASAGTYSFRMSDSNAGLGGDTLDAKLSLLDNAYNVVNFIDRIDSPYSSPWTANLAQGRYWLKVQTFSETAQTGTVRLQAVLPQGGL